MTHDNKQSGAYRLILCLALLGMTTVDKPAADNPVTAPDHQKAGWQDYERGAFVGAIVHWREARALYERDSDVLGESDVLLRIAEAYQALGRYPKATDSLNSAQQLAITAQDRGRQARILASFGALALAAGQEAEAEKALRNAQETSQGLGNASLSAIIMNNLGNLYMAQRRYPDALTAYDEALTAATTGNLQSLKTRATTNQATALVRLSRYAEAKTALDRASVDLQSLPPSHDQIYTLITVGLAYAKLMSYLPALHDDLMKSAFQVYHKAAEGAETIGDHRAMSYSWGYLGQLYEREQRFQDALEVTRRAILSGQQAVAPEILYRWHWQEGRLFAKAGHYPDALNAYRRAVFALQSVRADLIASTGSSSGSFREYAGGIYYDFVDLLLQRAADVDLHGESGPYLKEARDVVEMLKVDEMRNYFGDECVDAARSRIASIEQLSTRAAVIYPILLPDRLELIVSLPDGLHRVAVPVGMDRLTGEINRFRQLLEKRTTNEFLPHAQQLYEWLIRPIETLWESSPVTTLVFVPDGPLRQIPMAALHDGAGFVIQRYAVATTPGLTLTDPRPLKRQTVHTLAAGLSESVQGYPALPHVQGEIRAVHDLFGGDSLMNKDFVVQRVESELKAHLFSIVHIASHGQFEGDVRESFLLAYDDKLTMDRLDRFIGSMRYRDEPLALLTLSACETAAGDDRSALGLAGVAIKAGARSALATLWSINDESSSQLVETFYQQLRNPSVSKAAALQEAQLKLMDHPLYRHPAYWAAFLLLNNWL